MVCSFSDSGPRPRLGVWPLLAATPRSVGGAFKHGGRGGCGGRGARPGGPPGGPPGGRGAPHSTAPPPRREKFARQKRAPLGHEVFGTCIATCEEVQTPVFVSDIVTPPRLERGAFFFFRGLKRLRGRPLPGLATRRRGAGGLPRPRPRQGRG